MNKLSSNELLDYIIILNIIDNLYDNKELREKEYSYAAILQVGKIYGYRRLCHFDGIAICIVMARVE